MTKAIEDFKNLIRGADAIDSAMTKWKDFCADPKHYDKRGFGFDELDNRFVSVSVPDFSSHIGVYGSSSCSTFFHIDSKLGRTFMAKALNANRDLILVTMRDLLLKEAAKKKAEAKIELDALTASLASVESEVSQA